MSTFLELVQQLHRESGAGGILPQNVEGQTGESQRLVDWTREADIQVQTLWSNWKFLWVSHSLTTAQGTSSYAPPDDLANWDLETFLLDGDPLDAVEYELVRKQPRPTGEGKPYQAVIMPDNSLRLDQTPNKTYTLSADYFKVPAALSGNTDKSSIPERFHKVIVAQALLFYANYEEAPEIKQQGQELWGTWLGRLESSQSPESGYRFKSNDNDITIVAE